MTVLKRLISMMLMFVMVMIMTSPIQASNRTSLEMLFNESYGGYITNETPPELGGNILGRVVWRGSRLADKQLLMEGNGESYQLKYPFTESGEMVVVELSLKSPQGSTGSITLFENDTRKFTPVSFEEDGTFKTIEGKAISMHGGEYLDLAITINVKRKRFSVYSGGRCVLSNWYSASMNMGTIAGIIIDISTPEEGPSSIFLDDVIAYKGDTLVDRSLIPKSPINPAEQEYVPPIEEEIGQKVFCNLDFEDERNPFGSFTLTPKDNIIEIRKDKLKGSNVAYMKKTNTEDVYMDYVLAGTSRFMVFQTDIKIDVTDLNVALFSFRESLSGVQFNVRMSPGGQIRAHSNEVIGQLTPGRWHNVAMIADFNKKMFDFYVDGEQTANKITFEKRDMGPLELVRMYIYGGDGASDLSLDDFRIYEGKEIIDINNLPKPEARSAYPTDENTVKALQGFTALNVRSGNMFINDQKVTEACETDIRDGEIFVSKSSISKAFNIEETSDEFISLRPFVEDVLKKKYYTDGKDLVIIGDIMFQNPSISNDISQYLQYARPSKEWITENIEKTAQESRPRVLITQNDLDRLKDFAERDDGSMISTGLYQLLRNCEQGFGQEPEPYQIPDGMRLLETSRTVLRRVREQSLAYLLSGDKRYADRAWKELENAANYKDWNIYTHFLDGAELAMAFAIGYDWLHDYLTDEQKSLMRQVMMEYAIIPAYNYHYNIQVANQRVGNNFWIKNEYNWNVVCNGGVTVAALAIIDDIEDEELRDICNSTIQASLRSLEYMMGSFAPDGAWVEGAGYWGYTLDYLEMLLSTLLNRFDTEFGFTTVEGFSKTAEFITHLEGYTGTNNFHDAGMGRFNATQLFWLAKTLEKPDIGMLRLHFMKLYNVAPGFFDLLWYDEAFEDAEAELPLDANIRKIEYVSFRTSWTDPSKMYISAQGGQNNVAHHHLDGGTFVLDATGVRWAVDLGPEDYNHPAPNEQKYRYRTESHNTIVINPDAGPGQVLDAFAPVEKFVSKPRGGFAILNMSDYYAPWANSVRRGYKMEDDRKSSVVRDEIELKEVSDVYWFMTTGEKITIEDDHIILENSPIKKLRIDYSANVPVEVGITDAAPLATSPNPDGQMDNSRYKRIFIKANTSGRYELAVKFTPLDDMEFCTPLGDDRLDDWDIVDGELRPSPPIEGINIDGEPFKGFLKTGSYFTVNLPADMDTMPEITVDPAEGIGYNIIPASDPSGRTKIETYYQDEPSVKGAYYLEYYKFKKLAPIGGEDPIAISGIYASEIPQPENPDIHAVDGNLETRWSASGSGQWLELEFPREEEVDKVALAFYLGSTRKNFFSIEISTDGIHYEEVFEGESSGETDDYQYFDIGGKKARFVRFVGNQTETSSWNSVTEFSAFRK